MIAPVLSIIAIVFVLAFGIVFFIRDRKKNQIIFDQKSKFDQELSKVSEKVSDFINEINGTISSCHDRIEFQSQKLNTIKTAMELFYTKVEQWNDFEGITVHNSEIEMEGKSMIDFINLLPSMLQMITKLLPSSDLQSVSENIKKTEEIMNSEAFLKTQEVISSIEKLGKEQSEKLDELNKIQNHAQDTLYLVDRIKDKEKQIASKQQIVEKMLSEIEAISMNDLSEKIEESSQKLDELKTKLESSVVVKSMEEFNKLEKQFAQLNGKFSSLESLKSQVDEALEQKTYKHDNPRMKSLEDYLKYYKDSKFYNMKNINFFVNGLIQKAEDLIKNLDVSNILKKENTEKFVKLLKEETEKVQDVTQVIQGNYVLSVDEMQKFITNLETLDKTVNELKKIQTKKQTS